MSDEIDQVEETGVYGPPVRPTYAEIQYTAQFIERMQDRGAKRVCVGAVMVEFERAVSWPPEMRRRSTGDPP